AAFSRTVMSYHLPPLRRAVRSRHATPALAAPLAHTHSSPADLPALQIDSTPPVPRLNKDDPIAPPMAPRIAATIKDTRMIPIMNSGDDIHSSICSICAGSIPL